MLKHGILGLLNYGDKTGYEIKELFNQSLNYFWMAQTSQIYRELQKLEKENYIEGTVVKQQGKPNKKVFRITLKGQEELKRWLLDQSVSLMTNKPLLMKVFFLDELSIEKQIDFFKNLISNCQNYLDLLKPVSKSLNQDKHSSCFWIMTEDYGKRNLKMTIEWANDCLKKLEEIYENSNH